MSESGIDLGPVGIDALFAELRKRNPDTNTIIEQLKLPITGPYKIVGQKTLALLLTAILTAVLVVAIVVLAIQEKDIPELIAGLTGTGLGGIVGLIAAQEQAPSPPRIAPSSASPGAPTSPIGSGSSTSGVP